MIRGLLEDAAGWAPGVRLLVFVVLPAALVAQVLRAACALPLWLEYRVSTSLRHQRGQPLPMSVGDAAEGVYSLRASVTRATRLLLVVGVLAAAVSITDDLAPENIDVVSTVANSVSDVWQFVGVEPVRAG